MSGPVASSFVIFSVLPSPRVISSQKRNAIDKQCKDYYGQTLAFTPRTIYHLSAISSPNDHTDAKKKSSRMVHFETYVGVCSVIVPAICMKPKSSNSVTRSDLTSSYARERYNRKEIEIEN